MSRQLGRIAISLIALLGSGGVCVATHPVQIHEYRFVTDESQLQIQGGFAGIDASYQLFGSFGLIVDPHPHPSPDPQQPDSTVPAYEFTDVAVRLMGPPPFEGGSLDSLLDMSGWMGRLVSPDTILFRGTDAQQSPVRVEGRIGDAALWLEGGNQPPCCDLFHWRLDAVARIISITDLDADFNRDGVVDGQDFIIWQAGFGVEKNGTREMGDANGDGAINGSDFLIWQGQYDPGGDDDADQASLVAAVVPEPPGPVMSLFALLAFAAGRPNTRRRPPLEFPADNAR